MTLTRSARLARGTGIAALGALAYRPREPLDAAAAPGGANAGDFNPFPLFIALASAAAILIIGGMIQKRLGF